jgi:hypothetical protein
VQTSQLSDARVRSVHNFFKEIIDHQDLGKIYFFVYDKTVAFFYWKRDGSKRSRLIKEIEIQPPKEAQKEILRVFEFTENVNKFGIIVSTKTSIQS